MVIGMKPTPKYVRTPIKIAYNAESAIKQNISLRDKLESLL
jgi:hypothetical protein